MKLFTIVGTPSSSLSSHARAAVIAGQALGTGGAAQQDADRYGAYRRALDNSDSTVLAAGMPTNPMIIDPRPLAKDRVPSSPHERSP